VGNDGASLTYVGVGRACERVGFEFTLVNSTTSETELQEN
jgi:riboflavin synthase alpha subunit